MRKFIAGLLMFGATVLFLSAANAGDDEGAKKKKGDFAKKFDAESVFKKLDTDSNGKLSKDEYLKLADRVQDTAKADKMREFLGKAYDKFSEGTDGNGITLDQFKAARQNREGFQKRGNKKAPDKTT